MRASFTVRFGVTLFAFLVFIIMTQIVQADPPYVKVDAPTEVILLEDEEYLDLDLNDVFADDDPEDQQLNFSYYHEAEGLNVSINETSGRVAISGAEDLNGEVHVTFQADDRNGSLVIHAIKVIILPVNDPPYIVGYISALTIFEGEDSFINISVYFKDIDGDELYYYAENVTTDAYTLVNSGSDPRDPVFDILCQNPDFYGSITLTFQVYDRDPSNQSEEALSVGISAFIQVDGGHHNPSVSQFEPNETSVMIEELEVVVFRIIEIKHLWSYPLTYRWYVNGEEVPGHNLSSYQFPDEASYRSAGDFIITVELWYDDRFYISNTPEWTLTILDVNRGPFVTLVTESMKVEEGKDITLEATGSDPDGDVLMFRWYRSKDREEWTEVGSNQTFVLKNDLSPDDYYFKCVVDDGKGTSETGWARVTVEPKEVPGLSATIAFMTLLFASISLYIWSRGPRGHSKAY